MNAMVPTGGGNAMVPTNMDAAMRLAEMMARGKLVPQHLHNSPGDCLMVIEQAIRWGMSPFAVAQCTSVIQGKLMFEGKLVAAALHASGIMSSRLEYEFTGAGDGRAVIVRGTLKGETTPREFTLTLKDAKTNNGMWVKQPDQQLVYAATRGWARRHAPEVMLGVYAPEEFDAAPERPTEAFGGPTLEAKAETAVVEPKSTNGSHKPARKVSEVLDEIEAAFDAAANRDMIDAVLSGETVQKALDFMKGGAKERLERVIAAALVKFPTTPAEPVAEVAPDEADDDMEHAKTLAAQFRGCATDDAIGILAANPDIRRDMKRWKKDRPDCWEVVDTAAGERATELKSADYIDAGAEPTPS